MDSEDFVAECLKCGVIMSKMSHVMMSHWLQHHYEPPKKEISDEEIEYQKDFMSALENEIKDPLAFEIKEILEYVTTEEEKKGRPTVFASFEDCWNNVPIIPNDATQVPEETAVKQKINIPHFTCEQCGDSIEGFVAVVAHIEGHVIQLKIKAENLSTSEIPENGSGSGDVKITPNDSQGKDTEAELILGVAHDTSLTSESDEYEYIIIEEMSDDDSLIDLNAPIETVLTIGEGTLLSPTPVSNSPGLSVSQNNHISEISEQSLGNQPIEDLPHDATKSKPDTTAIHQPIENDTQSNISWRWSSTADLSITAPTATSPVSKSSHEAVVECPPNLNMAIGQRSALVPPEPKISQPHSTMVVIPDYSPSVKTSPQPSISRNQNTSNKSKSLCPPIAIESNMQHSLNVSAHANAIPPSTVNIEVTENQATVDDTQWKNISFDSPSGTDVPNGTSSSSVTMLTVANANTFSSLLANHKNTTGEGMEVSAKEHNSSTYFKTIGNDTPSHGQTSENHRETLVEQKPLEAAPLIAASDDKYTSSELCNTNELRPSIDQRENRYIPQNDSNSSAPSDGVDFIACDIENNSSRCVDNSDEPEDDEVVNIDNNSSSGPYKSDFSIENDHQTDSLNETVLCVVDCVDYPHSYENRAIPSSRMSHANMRPNYEIRNQAIVNETQRQNKLLDSLSGTDLPNRTRSSSVTALTVSTTNAPSSLLANHENTTRVGMGISAKEHDCLMSIKTTENDTPSHGQTCEINRDTLVEQKPSKAAPLMQTPELREATSDDEYTSSELCTTNEIRPSSSQREDRYIPQNDSNSSAPSDGVDFINCDIENNSSRCVDNSDEPEDDEVVNMDSNISLGPEINSNSITIESNMQNNLDVAAPATVKPPSSVYNEVTKNQATVNDSQQQNISFDSLSGIEARNGTRRSSVPTPTVLTTNTLKSWLTSAKPIKKTGNDTPSYGQTAGIHGETFLKQNPVEERALIETPKFVDNSGEPEDDEVVNIDSNISSDPEINTYSRAEMEARSRPIVNIKNKTNASSLKMSCPRRNSLLKSRRQNKSVDSLSENNAPNGTECSAVPTLRVLAASVLAAAIASIIEKHKEVSSKEHNSSIPMMKTGSNARSHRQNPKNQSLETLLKQCLPKLAEASSVIESLQRLNFPCSSSSTSEITSKQQHNPPQPEKNASKEKIKLKKTVSKKRKRSARSISDNGGRKVQRQIKKAKKFMTNTSPTQSQTQTQTNSNSGAETESHRWIPNNHENLSTSQTSPGNETESENPVTRNLHSQCPSAFSIEKDHQTDSSDETVADVGHGVETLGDVPCTTNSSGYLYHPSSSEAVLPESLAETYSLRTIRTETLRDSPSERRNSDYSSQEATLSESLAESDSHSTQRSEQISRQNRSHCKRNSLMKDSLQEESTDLPKRKQKIKRKKGLKRRRPIISTSESESTKANNPENSDEESHGSSSKKTSAWEKEKRKKKRGKKRKKKKALKRRKPIVSTYDSKKANNSQNLNEESHASSSRKRSVLEKEKRKEKKALKRRLPNISTSDSDSTKGNNSENSNEESHGSSSKKTSMWEKEKIKNKKRKEKRKEKEENKTKKALKRRRPIVSTSDSRKANNSQNLDEDSHSSSSKKICEWDNLVWNSTKNGASEHAFSSPHSEDLDDSMLSSEDDESQLARGTSNSSCAHQAETSHNSAECSLINEREQAAPMRRSDANSDDAHQGELSHDISQCSPNLPSTFSDEHINSDDLHENRTPLFKPINLNPSVSSSPVSVSRDPKTTMEQAAPLPPSDDITLESSEEVCPNSRGRTAHPASDARLDLHQLVQIGMLTDVYDCIKFLREHQLLKSEMNCSKCKIPMRQKKDASRKDGYRWRCKISGCTASRSIRKGSCLERSSVGLFEFILNAHFLNLGVPQRQRAYKGKVGPTTIVNLGDVTKEASSSDPVSKESQIGDLGLMVSKGGTQVAWQKGCTNVSDELSDKDSNAPIETINESTWQSSTPVSNTLALSADQNNHISEISEQSSGNQPIDDLPHDVTNLIQDSTTIHQPIKNGSQSNISLRPSSIAELPIAAPAATSPVSKSSNEAGVECPENLNMAVGLRPSSVPSDLRIAQRHSTVVVIPDHNPSVFPQPSISGNQNTSNKSKSLYQPIAIRSNMQNSQNVSAPAVAIPHSSVNTEVIQNQAMGNYTQRQNKSNSQSVRIGKRTNVYSHIIFLRRVGLLKSEMKCSKCGRPMRERKDVSRKDDYRWHCKNCGTYKTIRKGSLFERSPVELSDYIRTYFPAVDVQQQQVVYEGAVSTTTILDWEDVTTEACSSEPVSKESQIGDLGHMVSLDGTQGARRTGCTNDTDELFDEESNAPIETVPTIEESTWPSPTPVFNSLTLSVNQNNHMSDMSEQSSGNQLIDDLPHDVITSKPDSTTLHQPIKNGTQCDVS